MAGDLKTLRVGLTGGIGSGKSTVAALLVQAGATLIDTDAIARRLTQPAGPAMPAIREAFGDEVVAPDGGLDRARLRSTVFNDPQARRRLEAILHPLISEECDRQAHAAGPVAMLVFDVPLLVESGRWRARVDRVLVVDCLESTQVDRVCARSGWEPEMVLAVMAQQAPRSTRLAAADAVIFNDGLMLEELATRVQSLWHAWCSPTG